MNAENKRRLILNFLVWNDKNANISDEDCDLAGVERLSYEDVIRDFFCIINSDFYYRMVDNIFELSCNQVISLAKDNLLYEDTINKLNKLLAGTPNDIELYKSILQ